MTHSPQHWHGMALWAKRKADEAATSDQPWALANLRAYQNLYSRWLGEYYRAARNAGIEPEKDL